MRKSDKKLEKTIVSALTLACEQIKVCVDDFEWLTHDIDYQKFPDSLVITCVFSSTQAINLATQSGEIKLVAEIIRKKLQSIDIKLASPKPSIKLTTEAELAKHSHRWH
ncbi:Fis family transcriptional regulator [Aliikangiella sp. IMCC44653]